MSPSKVACALSYTPYKQTARQKGMSQIARCKRTKSQEPIDGGGSQLSNAKLNREKIKNKYGIAESSNMSPMHLQPVKSDTARRKSPVNPEIRLAAPKSDKWLRKNVETSLKSPIAAKLKYVPRRPSVTANPTVTNVKPVDGRRPALKMPAIIPRASKRKHKYVIAVVGSEIKLLDPKPKSLRSDIPRLQRPAFKNGTAIQIRAVEQTAPKKRGKKGKELKNSKQVTEMKFQVKNNDENSMSVVKVMQHENNRENSDLDLAVTSLNLSSDVAEKKVNKFSDRRAKIDLSENSVCLTKDAPLMEKPDPISKIVNIEYVDSVQRCQAVTDFLTEPTDNPNPPFLNKRIFIDSTMMEELNFLPLLSSDLMPDPVVLPLVPKFRTENAKRSLSWPVVEPVKSDVRGHPTISHQKKKRLKLETILATRPKGFHHAKWLEKTVASDSHLKTKLLRDVIISQVSKLLKGQAELRSRIREKNLIGLDVRSR